MRGESAWENKAPGKNLDAALRQLLSYSLALANPPILVVSDRLTIRIPTQFTGHSSELHEVRIGQMDQPDKLALLRRIWTAPDSFKPLETSRDITKAAARSFAALAVGLRQRPAWLAQARAQLDTAAAYGWADWHPGRSDDDILRRLLALNLARTSRAGALPADLPPV